MRASKIYKIITVVFLVAIISTAITYWQLTTRHKAIVKGYVFEKIGIVEKDWTIDTASLQFKMISPSFYIDGLYKSMEGPKSSQYIQLSKNNKILWLTGFEVKAVDEKQFTPLSNDFVCHTNIDFNDVSYYTNLKVADRIGKQYPRLISLSHGLERFNLPEGYGVPMVGNELLYVTSQSLNHNIPNIDKWIKHEVTIRYSKDKKLKPLMSKTAFIMLPYDKENPYKTPLDPGSNQCIPVETNNHSYDDNEGNKLSGHWVIPKGKNKYKTNINNQLQIKDSLRLHVCSIHVHPFATRILLFDKTKNNIIFSSKITNHKNSIGLTKVAPFSSVEGIWLYKNHEYEIILEVNNTSNQEQDMMGSMFLFFYDEKLDRILN